MKPRYIVFDKIVVVGRAVFHARNTAFQVSALAVPLSLILIISCLPCTRVHPGALNKSAPACAVTMNISRLSIFKDVPVSVVYEAAESTIGVVVFTRIPSTASVPAALRESVVSLAFPSSKDPTPSAVDVDDTSHAIGSPVQFVRVPDVGVPRTGVVRVGEVSVLFVSVSVVALPTSVSVASGKSIVLLDPVELLRRVVIIPVPLFETQNRIRFVSSAASQTLTSPVPFPTR